MNKIYNIVCVIGTRPEALKMAPVIKALELEKNIRVSTILTAQHRSLLDQILTQLDIAAVADFNIMTDNQQLSELTARLLDKFADYFKHHACDLLVAQGDTTTTMVAALTSFYHKIPFVHIEAGLRTSDINNPFPEELNRRIASQIATLHCCPTEVSKRNLIKEGIGAGVFVTGNTIIDTLYSFVKKAKLTHEHENQRKTILVTCHRRENFGQPLENICIALKQIVKNHHDVDIIFPVHPNPNVKKTVYHHLDNIDRIELTEALNYQQLTLTLAKCFLVLTDSGGLQEEAPALKKPVLILRNQTERPEGITCGAAKIVGTETYDIVSQVDKLLFDNIMYETMCNAGSPYGDGRAAERIVKIITDYLHKPHSVFLQKNWNPKDKYFIKQEGFSNYSVCND